MIWSKMMKKAKMTITKYGVMVRHLNSHNRRACSLISSRTPARIPSECLNLKVPVQKVKQAKRKKSTLMIGRLATLQCQKSRKSPFYVSRQDTSRYCLHHLGPFTTGGVETETSLPM